jgi:hypothetical protein
VVRSKIRIKFAVRRATFRPPKKSQKWSESISVTKEPELSTTISGPDVSRPPKRLATRTKGIWQTLPVPLREDIVAREVEFDNAFKKYDGLGQYVLQAEKAGTTLAKQLESYVAAANELRRDFLAAIEGLCGVFGHHPMVLANAIAAKFAPLPQPAPQVRQQPDPEVIAANAAITTFRADPRNEFMPIVEPAMREELLSGRASSLYEAYSNACEMSSHVQEIKMARQRPSHIRYQTVADRARAQAKAIGGAPATTPTSGRPEYDSVDAHDAVRKAVAAQRDR